MGPLSRALLAILGATIVFCAMGLLSSTMTVAGMLLWALLVVLGCAMLMPFLAHLAAHVSTRKSKPFYLNHDAAEEALERYRREDLDKMH